MKTRNFLLIALLGVGVLLVFQRNTVQGTNTVQLPEFVVVDQNDVVLGPLSGASTLGQTFVLMRDPGSGENFHVAVARDHFGSGDTSDVFFTNGNCTGDAYVLEPGLFNSVAEIRGSVYGVGPDDAGGTSCCKVYRGAGTPANRDGLINSRYRSSASNGPACEGFDPGVNTVPATAVLDLSTIVFPLKLQ